MPFYIMHVNIWSPVHLVDTRKDTIQLMNLMCDLTQLDISSVVWNMYAKILAKTFMEEVALSFIITAVIVVDSDRKFGSVFEDMCKALKDTCFHSLEVTTKDSQLRNIIVFSKKHK